MASRTTRSSQTQTRRAAWRSWWTAVAVAVAAAGLLLTSAPGPVARADGDEAEVPDRASEAAEARPAAATAAEGRDRPESAGQRSLGALAFPGIEIDIAGREIRVSSWFAMVVAATELEYLGVTERGKLHEALFAIECEPEKLQLGLILLGLEPKPELRYQGEARELTGPRVRIEAEFLKAGETIRLPVEALLYDRYLGRSPDVLGFAFTGSRFREARGDEPAAFAAQATGNAIALYHDPDACLDNPRYSGGDIPLMVPTLGMAELVDWLSADDRLYPNPATTPDRGTECTLVLTPFVREPVGKAKPVGEAAAAEEKR